MKNISEAHLRHPDILKHENIWSVLSFWGVQSLITFEINAELFQSMLSDLPLSFSQISGFLQYCCCYQNQNLFACQSVRGAVTHLLRSHFLCLINIQEGWRLTNKLKTWISLQLSSKYFSCKVCVLAKALFWKNTLHVYAFRYNQKLGSFIVFLHRGLLGANRKSVTMTCLSHMKH